MKQLYRIIWIVCLSSMALLFSASPNPVYAATFVVDSTDDAVDANPGDGVCATATNVCTLRAAIQEANALPGADIIEIPAGIYTLSIPGTLEDDAATGDLDIRQAVTIIGAGPTSTIIDGGGLDRVFDLITFAGQQYDVTIENLTIRNGGNLPAGTANVGAGIGQRSNTTGIVNLTLNNVIITANDNVNNGGGVGFARNFSAIGTPSLTINNSVINGNFASSGAGIQCGGCLLTLNNTTIHNNNASTNGGGIEISTNFSVVQLVNSTVSGNSANNNGGGIAKGFGSGTIAVNFSTITLNTADANNSGTGDGGGIFANSNTTIQNSIVQSNTDVSTPALNDCNSNTNISSNGYNVVGTGCPIGGTGDTTTAASLGPLQNNGGPTPTHAPLSDSSAAVDIAPAANCTGAPVNGSDQRGVSRPQDGTANGDARCDAGAVEFVPTLCSITTGVNYTYGEVIIHFDDLASTNLACLSVEYVDGNHPNATSSGSNDALETGRYWRINGFQNDGVTPATGTFQVDVTLPYAGADGNSRACKWLEGVGPGFGWDCGTNLDNSASTGVSVTRNNYTGGFSDWAAGDNVGPTAVSFQSLTAVSQQGGLAALIATLLTALSGIWLWGRRQASDS